MKLASFRARSGEVRVGVLHGETLVDAARAYAASLAAKGEGERAAARAETLIPADMRLVLEGGETSLAALRQAIAFAADALADPAVQHVWRSTGRLYDLSDIRFLPPIPRPGKIISIGANYRQHLDEFHEDADDAKGLAAVVGQLGKASYPPGFAKLSSTLAGHEQPLVYPSCTRQFDYEAELCVVIGRRCKNVAPEDYLDVVAGYTIINDVSMRDLQSDEMRRGVLLMGKNLDTTAPTGPYLVTKDEIRDPMALQIDCWVNGERRQHASTAGMIFNIAAIIAYYSRMTLEPGDMFTTGSPAGVGITSATPEKHLLKPGDLIEIEIEGLGRLRNRVVAEDDTTRRPMPPLT